MSTKNPIGARLTDEALIASALEEFAVLIQNPVVGDTDRNLTQERALELASIIRERIKGQPETLYIYGDLSSCCGTYAYVVETVQGIGNDQFWEARILSCNECGVEEETVERWATHDED